MDINRVQRDAGMIRGDAIGTMARHRSWRRDAMDTVTPNAGKIPAPVWPLPLRPGPEMAAMKRFHRNVTWTGTVKATPLTPEMTATGRGRFHEEVGGLWIVGEFHQDQFSEGRKVTDWGCLYIAGWDASRQTYVAFAADSNGRCVPFAGVIEGDRFTITSEGATIGGAPVRLRMIWDAGGAGAMTWRNEMSIAGGPWSLIEEYDMIPE